ncbi:MAG: hypothetical protein J6T05_07560 [Prevotella sp.]|nr:hypothetical protein [Prevotella sp.]
MENLVSPLEIVMGGISRTDNIKESINSFLEILLTSACGDCCIDPEFGFIFNNMRFEIFNEREGTIYNSTTPESEEEDEMYTKKISGNSRNLNTFATDLKEVIMKYEHRLADVAATMSYVREERKIYVTVTGVIIDTKEKYKYDTTLKIWS